MTRLQNIEKAGYYPLPHEIAVAISSAFSAPEGGRILDPCAGKGQALHTISNSLELVPYAIEVNKDRAEKAKEILPDNYRAVINCDFRLATVSKQMANLLYVNPPYDSDIDDGRLEYQFLRDSRQWLMPGGWLVYVVPQHVLKMQRLSEYLLSWFEDVDVARFPDPYFDRFNQVIVFGRHRKKIMMVGPTERKLFQENGTAPKEELITFGEFDEESKTVVINEAMKGIFSLPPLSVLSQDVTFRSNVIQMKDIREDIKDHGVQTLTDWAEQLQPSRETMTELKPLTPLKVGHMTGIIAAGHLNNQVLKSDEDETEVLIKGRSFKKLKYTSEVTKTDEATTSKVIGTERVVTDITTLNSQGEVVNYNGKELVEFMKEWGEKLTNIVAKDYPPEYEFDMNGYGDAISQLNRKRKIPGLRGRTGLLPTQEHVVAAAATRLKKHRECIIVGEMGVGKTIMGAGVAPVIGAKRVLVLCPAHLVKKWKREIAHVVPRATTTELVTISDVDEFFAAEPLKNAPRFAIIKPSSAKMGSGWLHGYDFCGPVKHYRQDGKVQELTWLPKSYEMYGFPEDEPEDKRRKHLVPLYVADWEELDENGKERRYLSFRGIRCATCGHQQMDNGLPATPLYFKKKKRNCQCKDSKDSCQCNEPLWQNSASKGRPKHPLATYIHKRYKKQIDLLIADEVHMYKGGDTDQGFAFHRLASSSKKLLLLTGTIYGGKASSIFYLLYRTVPEMAKHYKYNDEAKWVAQYGILQTIETVRESHSKQTGSRKASKMIKEAPGGSPAMLPWLLNRSIFVSLNNMGYALPPYEEIPVGIDMTEEMAKTYASLEGQIVNEMRKRLARGDKSLLSGYLRGLLSWPDSPWREKGIRDPHDDSTIAWVDGLDEPPGSYPKEEAILDLIESEKAEGRRVLLLCEQTATLDITGEWVEMLQRRGLTASVLRCSPKAREKWIETQVENNVDVIISHARRVETGLDLLEFPTIVWMAPNYSVFTVMQASRRSWRIGQEKPVKVYFYAYNQTLQTEALKLIAAKVAAAIRINGDTIADDSLAEMNDLASGGIMETLIKIVMKTEAHPTESLQEAFAVANKAIKSDVQLIGGYENPQQNTLLQVEAKTADEVAVYEILRLVQDDLDPHKAGMWINTPHIWKNFEGKGIPDVSNGRLRKIRNYVRLQLNVDNAKERRGKIVPPDLADRFARCVALMNRKDEEYRMSHSTQGVRESWNDLHEWVCVWDSLMQRQDSSDKYMKMKNHLNALAENINLIKDEEMMLPLKATYQIAWNQRPPEGKREAHATTAIIVAVNNAIATHSTAEEVTAVLVNESVTETTEVDEVTEVEIVPKPVGTQLDAAKIIFDGIRQMRNPQLAMSMISQAVDKLWWSGFEWSEEVVDLAVGQVNESLAHDYQSWQADNAVAEEEKIRERYDVSGRWERFLMRFEEVEPEPNGKAVEFETELDGEMYQVMMSFIDGLEVAYA